MFFSVVIVVDVVIFDWIVFKWVRSEIVESRIVNFVSIRFGYCVDVICGKIIVFYVERC